jgi:dihydroorotase
MLIQFGRVIDPAQHIDAVLDVRLRHGVVAELGEHLEPQPDEQAVDARGAFVAPGFIDMHVHLREPGNPEKETIASGTAAAVAGGFTAVAAMPNTNPAIDSPELVQTLLGYLDGAFCRVYPIAAITRGRKGTELVDYSALAANGAVAFSDDGNTVMDAGLLRAAALASRDVNGCFISHCEDETLKDEGVMNEGAASRRMNLPASPALAEDVIVARDILIARDTGKRWHIAHLSTAGAVALVTEARHSGVLLTSEVTPHHLLFTDELVERLGSGAKVNPPLRSLSDVEALRAAVRRGDIDAFATDHAPHTAEEKNSDVTCGAVGFSGLEIAVGAYAYAVPDLPLSRFVAMLSTNPARILGVPGGSLALGAPADITVFADREWTVDASAFHSKGKATPFDGMTLPRRAIATIVAGKLVMQEERIFEGVHS